MTTIDPIPTTYEAEIREWQQTMDEKLRAEDGWLTLSGLYWLRPGSNTVGSDPSCDVVLDAADVPAQLGRIEFVGGVFTLIITGGVAVTVGGEAVTTAVLRHDHAEGGPSLVQLGSLTFFVIERGGDCGVRVRDSRHPARLSFAGRQWFPIDLGYRVTGQFRAHEVPRVVQVSTSAGNLIPVTNVGRVEFVLHDQPLALEALESGAGELWFVFKDGTSGQTTYGAGRFLNAPLDEDGRVDLDFNRAHHPPCAFTAFATCPRPLKENVLSLEIAAGERH